MIIQYLYIYVWVVSNRVLDEYFSKKHITINHSVSLPTSYLKYLLCIDNLNIWMLDFIVIQWYHLMYFVIGELYWV